LPRPAGVLVATAYQPHAEALENNKDAIQEYLAAIADSLKEADVQEVEVSM